MRRKKIFLMLLTILLSWMGQIEIGLAANPTMEPDRKWLRRELQRMKLPKNFIEESLQDYQEKTFATVVRLNLLGFLLPSQHMDRVTEKSVEQTAHFIEANKKAFERSEMKYQIPASVVSALLWIETRHGEDRGDFQVVSVYLHLLQSNRKALRAQLTTLALEKNQERGEYTPQELRRIMGERCLKRRTWAVEQLRALAEIHQTRKLNLATLKGSYAGAFGLPQFIPSSYLNFARSSVGRRAPDLTKTEDAIFSVAHYLKKHGWKAKKEKAQIEALMKYNNSRDYADSILEISRRTKVKNLGRQGQMLSRAD